MRQPLRFALLLVALAPTAFAQNWSIGLATGPFVFGRFVERTSAIGNETGGTTVTSRLSAATRPGLEADVERDFGRWLGLRLTLAWTYAPMRVKSGDGGVDFEAGHIGVTTLALPLVVHLNRGSVRFHLAAGPAYALYHGTRRGAGGEPTPLFTGTRGRWGGIASGGLVWWWSDRFGVDGEISDIVTSTPFKFEDVAPTSQGIRLKRPQNVHTTVGLRYRF